jgi:hypothetical protein
MIRKLLPLGFLIALPLVSAFAQQKTDFSGTWKLNVGKSDYGALPGPNSRTDVITQKDPAITDHVTSEGQQGKLDYTANYSSDGKETSNTVGEYVLKSTSKWEGNNLAVKTRLKVNDTDVDVLATWMLAADGKTLTIAVHITSAMGETDQKLIFEKQEGDMAAPAKS